MGLALTKFKLIGIVLLVIGAFAFGVRYEKGQQARTEVLIAKAGEAAAKSAAEAIAKIEVKNVTKIQTLEKETIEHTVYTQCLHTDESFRLLNDLLTGGSVSVGNGELPATDTPSR